jgi:hypothetical protein
MIKQAGPHDLPCLNPGPIRQDQAGIGVQPAFPK